MVFKKNNKEKIRRGVITAHYGVAVDVFFRDDSTTNMIRVKRNSGHVVGDSVTVQGELLKRLERSSELSRMDARGGIHIVGANLDVLCIVVSCEPLSPPGFIDRATVAARAANLQPVLVMNKSDLAERGRPEWAELYESLGYPVLEVSAKTKRGLPTLQTTLAGRISAFVGPSGVGKSSLINAIVPGLDLDTATVSEHHGKGRHTTRVATLHGLPSGGFLADTPGIRELGTWKLPLEELDRCFLELAERRSSCAFRRCSHTHEPHCAVLEAVARGEIDAQRYESYVKLREEACG